MAIENFTDAELFIPDVESANKPVLDGTEKVFTQNGLLNEYMETQKIADLGGNFKVDAADTTPGTLDSKIDSNSPIELVPIGAGNKTFSLRNKAVVGTDVDMDSYTTTGYYEFDTATNGILLSGYSNTPPKLTLVDYAISMESANLQVVSWGFGVNMKMSQMFTIVASINGTTDTLAFKRTFYGGSWTNWVDLSGYVYNSRELDLNNYAYQGEYGFDLDSNLHGAYSNLPSVLPAGVADLDTLFVRLNEATLITSVSNTNSASTLIQILKIPYDDGTPRFFTYERYKSAGVFKAWYLIADSGGGGGAFVSRIEIIPVNIVGTGTINILGNRMIESLLILTSLTGDLLMGTTVGGNEILDVPVINTVRTVTLGNFYTAATNIHFTGDVTGHLKLISYA